MRSGTMTKMRRKSKCNTRYYVHGGRYSTTVRPTYLGRSPPHAVAYTCSAAVVLHLCRIQCSWWYAPKNAAGDVGYPQRAGRSNSIAYVHVLVRSLLQDIPASLLENYIQLWFDRFDSSSKFDSTIPYQTDPRFEIRAYD